MAQNIAEERKKAFTNFLLLFIISIVIIVATIFFSIWVPFRQNEQLRSQVDKFEKEKDFSKKFSNQVTAISVALDTNNNRGVNQAQVYADIGINLDKLSGMVETSTDSIYNKILYRNVVLNLRDLRTTNMKLLELVTTSAAEIKKRDEKVNDLGQKVGQANNRFTAIRDLMATYSIRMDFQQAVSQQLTPIPQ